MNFGKRKKCTEFFIKIEIRSLKHEKSKNQFEKHEKNFPGKMYGTKYILKINKCGPIRLISYERVLSQSL